MLSTSVCRDILCYTVAVEFVWYIDKWYKWYKWYIDKWYKWYIDKWCEII